MADLDLRDRKQFEAWLKTQPRALCVAIAARAALRVLPILELEFEGRRRPEFLAHEFVLPMIFVSMLPLVVAKYPARVNELGAAFATAREAAAGAGRGLVRAGGPAAGAASSASSASAVAAASAADQSIADDEVPRAAGSACTWAFAAARALAIGDEEYSRFVVASFKDAEWISNSATTQNLAIRPLWPGVAPAWATYHWCLLQERLLALKDENWNVWTRWYEAVLHGQPAPGGEELDIYRVTLRDPDPALNDPDGWSKGPAHVNALIRKKEEEIAARIGKSKTSEAELAAFASPEPFINVSGKLDVSPNTVFDVALVDDDLPSLPLRQRRVVDVVLSDLPRQAPGHLNTALKSYRNELTARGTQPIVGILRDMAEIIEAACAANDGEWLAAGMRTSFDIFSKNNEVLLKHFPLDEKRENRFAEIEVRESAAVGADFLKPFREAENLVALRDDVSDDTKLVVSTMRELAEVVAYMPPAKPYLSPAEVTPDVGALWQYRPSRVSIKKRLILQARGFWGACKPVIEKLAWAVDLVYKLNKIAEQVLPARRPSALIGVARRHGDPCKQPSRNGRLVPRLSG